MVKIDKIINRRTQLFFGSAGVNFKSMRQKRERREKNFIATQPNFLCEHAPYHQKEHDSSLSTPPWMKDFGNRTSPHTSPE
jgi:hypothetical protein